MEYQYDIALSFAGEDRDYASSLAEELKDRGIKVFYDEFEEVELWGKDLGIHFDYVYRRGAKYCIPIISRHYREKIWTKFEVRNAISRAIESNEEYILPARLDDTEIDGIRSTISYINLKKYTPTQFADLIAQKLGKTSDPIQKSPTKQDEESDNIYLGVNYVFKENQFSDIVLRVGITNIIKEHRYFSEPVFRLTKPFEDKADAFFLVDKLVPVDFPLKLEYGEQADVSYILRKASIQVWEQLPPDTEVFSIVSTTLGERFHSKRIKVSEIIETFRKAGS